MTGPGRGAALLGCLLAAAVAAAEPPSAADLAADLGHPLFARREAASRQLWELGEPARPALRKAAAGDDPEAARRAKAVLDRFDWGLYPDTPPAVAELIGRFRSGNPGRQRAALADLVRHGPAADRALAALLSRTYPAGVRDWLFETYTGLLRAEVPRRLAAGQADRAEALLALHLRGPDPDGLLDYALFLKGQNRPAPTAVPPRAAVFLARAAGDIDKAVHAAADLAKTDHTFQPTYEALLADVGDWKALARQPVREANSDDGLRAFRLKLAGRTTEADKLLDAQSDAPPTRTPLFSAGALDEATMALLLNDRPRDGIARLRKLGSAPHILTDLLAARLEFDEALALLDATGPADKEFDPRFQAVLRDTRKGLLLARMGKRDEAATAFARAASQLRRGDDTDVGEYLLTQLVRAEVKAGRTDLACNHLGAAVVWFERLGNRPRFRNYDPFEALFEADADPAKAVWAALRAERRRDADPAPMMRLVRSLLTGRATPAEVDRAVRAVGRGTVRDADEFDREMAVAAVYRAAGRTEDAIRVLAAAADRPPPAVRVESDDPFAALPAGFRDARGARGWVYGTDERFKFWIELGDLLTEQGRHKEAADRLEQGWRQNPDNPIPLYLSGRALVAAGDEAAGRRRMALAHQVALGNARIRGRFLEELVNRGFAADATAERELARAAAWAGDSYVGNVWNQAARAAALNRDYAGAAVDSRRAIHHLLKTPRLTYSDGAAYLTVPVGVRSYEARAALAAGDPAAAVSKAKACLDAMPDNAGLVIGLVPELDRAGDTAGADAVFDTAWAAFDKLIRAHPKTAWGRAGAAWLAAGCRRKLDTALEYAKFAVEADPEVKGYQEALAEVQFRRGDRAGATEIMSRLVALDRHSHHYRRQLARYQSAGFDSPLPDADED